MVNFWYTGDFRQNITRTCLFSSAIFTQFFNKEKRKIVTTKLLKNPNIMKKLIYIVILFVVSAMSITACTEQEIKPRNSGGGAIDPKG